MDRPFPFGFPPPTAVYLALYISTLVLHVVFMNYVLAGTGYMAAAMLSKRTAFGPKPQSASVEILRDWMPFALSAAITAGIAPLLFVQILYQKPFYTANLLLFHRWMSILPVLIVGFYLLYLLKAKRIELWRPVVQRAVGVTAFLCFAYTGYSWTENHLLSLDARHWTTQYASQSMWYASTLTAPRFAVWLFGSISTMSCILLWQLRAKTAHGDVAANAEASDDNPSSKAARGLSALSVAGLVLSVAAAGWYHAAAGPAHREAMTAPISRLYLFAAAAGLALQVVGWVAIHRARRIDARWLLVVSIGALLTILSTSVVREAVRIAHMDMGGLVELHRRAATAGGFAVFLGFFALNAILVYVSIRLVRPSGDRKRA